MRQDHPLAAKGGRRAAGSGRAAPHHAGPLVRKKKIRSKPGWGDGSPTRLAVYMNLSAYNKMVLTDNGVGLALGLDFDTVLPGLCMRPMKPFIENGSYMVWKRTSSCRRCWNGSSNLPKHICRSTMERSAANRAPASGQGRFTGRAFAFAVVLLVFPFHRSMIYM